MNALNDFVRWCRCYSTEITWFIIGFLIFAGLDELSHGNDIFALVNFVLAFINYICYRKKF